MAAVFGDCGYSWKEAAVCFVSFGADRRLEAFGCFELSCSASSIDIVFSAASDVVRALSSSHGC